jgi:hypothetical protein
MSAEKPSVLERLCSALNSSDLSPREGHVGAVELIAALAYTQTNPDAAEHGEMEAAHIDPRTELASVLVRLKYGGDRVLGERAVLLLMQWVRHQKAFRNWKLHPAMDGMLERFVRFGLAEWMYPVCQACHGRELLGLEKGELVERRVRCTRCAGHGFVTFTHTSKKQGGKTGKVRRDCLSCGGSGWRMHRRVRQEKTRQCDICFGSGRRRPNDGERVRALGVEMRTYQRHWIKRFSWLAAGLDRLDALQRHCLQSQMRAGINRA